MIVSVCPFQTAETCFQTKCNCVIKALIPFHIWSFICDHKESIAQLAQCSQNCACPLAWPIHCHWSLYHFCFPIQHISFCQDSQWLIYGGTWQPILGWFTRHWPMNRVTFDIVKWAFIYRAIGFCVRAWPRRQRQWQNNNNNKYAAATRMNRNDERMANVRHVRACHGCHPK